MEKKIYIVTIGEYSDYGIDAVFTTKEKAVDYVGIAPAPPTRPKE